MPLWFGKSECFAMNNLILTIIHAEYDSNYEVFTL